MSMNMTYLSCARVTYKTNLDYRLIIKLDFTIHSYSVPYYLLISFTLLVNLVNQITKLIFFSFNNRYQLRKKYFKIWFNRYHLSK